MDKVREIHLVALHLFQGALESELPGYAELMRHAADELEKQAFELERNLDRDLINSAAMTSARKRRVRAKQAAIGRD